MTQDFKPPRQRGFILHFGALLLNIAIIVFLILQALVQVYREYFILYLVSAILLFLPIPFISYRLFALLRSRYTVSREGIRIQWGLRDIIIPMQEIEWVRFAKDLAISLPLPPISINGAVIGLRFHHDLGLVEFLASDASNLVLIASRDRIYAISPRDAGKFYASFTHNIELGSIAPISSSSVSADFLVSAIFQDRVARVLILIGIISSIVLLILTSFIIPFKQTVPLGFNPAGQSEMNSPSERLLLFPVLSLLMLILDIGLGAYLYRKENLRTASYLAFASSLILPLSFFGILIKIII